MDLLGHPLNILVIKENKRIDYPHTHRGSPERPPSSWGYRFGLTGKQGSVLERRGEDKY